MASPRTRSTIAPNAPTDAELGSAAQRDRRKRILDATLALASKGGYEAVQMRTVAQRADVALGTLYRYFPSKIHLLVSGLAREFERLQEKLNRAPIPGAISSPSSPGTRTGSGGPGCAAAPAGRCSPWRPSSTRRG